MLIQLLLSEVRGLTYFMNIASILETPSSEIILELLKKLLVKYPDFFYRVIRRVSFSGAKSDLNPFPFQ